MNDITPQLKTLFQDRLKENELLSKHTNFRVGGLAHWFVDIRTIDELKQVLILVQKQQIPWFVMGGGSNILASDEGFSGVVLQMAMRGSKIEGTHVIVEAGATTAALARTTAEAGLEGLEWAISLPGTIGGAVRGNAGCFGGEMKDVVEQVTVLRNGQMIVLKKDDLQFGYRESFLKHSKDIVVKIEMILRPGDSVVLKEKMKEILEKRKASQPLSAGSAGCIFKNYDIANEIELARLKQEADIPPAVLVLRRVSAGWLVDQLDLKGTKIGDAQISLEHGNFMLNLGHATASEIVQLIALVKTKASDRFGIYLQEEIEYVGF
ncbi:MAG: UDP-N-acetylenolpyruvoylglucosamine reductase [Candidatus Uhrbacteria bacterium GW2011_GWF2_41_16]|uniref:UDP-N-acetylenolpyruvoylglucosamine reductase n=1 Tax=Candidatus Uhrbacteria bacterium GW2011_GWF2_41_16 TaxID=1618997 RepID=A0A0G0YAS3_9BACT|nr:MAG: UDP-N-acetylenolpyruvoylglucosamine reductase [Candidatus Uhrbacteria bacterium GW2011_GWF2_41_16]